jgi:hypothetical protein
MVQRSRAKSGEVQETKSRIVGISAEEWPRGISGNRLRRGLGCAKVLPYDRREVVRPLIFRRLFQTQIVQVMKTGGRKEKGRGAAYALAEIMVAIFVLGVMIVSLYAGFAAGLAVVQLARENLRATQIMLKRTEDIRLYTWSQLTNSTILKTNFITYYNPPGTNNNTQGTAYGVSVNPLDALPAAIPGDYRNKMRAITITVSWTNHPTGVGSGTNRSIVRIRQMQTYAARYGMQPYIYQ